MIAVINICKNTTITITTIKITGTILIISMSQNDSGVGESCVSFFTECANEVNMRRGRHLTLANRHIAALCARVSVKKESRSLCDKGLDWHHAKTDSKGPGVRIVSRALKTHQLAMPALLAAQCPPLSR